MARVIEARPEPGTPANRQDDGVAREESNPVSNVDSDLDEARLLARFTAHELKNPLRAIGNTADYIARKLHENDFDPVDLAGLATDISREAASMSEQLDDLRSLDGADVGGLVAVDLDRLVAGAVNRLHDQLHACQGQVIIDPLPTVAGRRGYLTTVVGNILNNAVRYRSERSLTVHITAERDDGGYHVIAFADNGRGIDPADHGRIFAPYGRIDLDVAGSGLGLALSRRIMDRLGGSIWVESHRGRGATFYLRLAPAP